MYPGQAYTKSKTHTLLLQIFLSIPPAPGSRTSCGYRIGHTSVAGGFPALPYLDGKLAAYPKARRTRVSSRTRGRSEGEVTP